MAARLLQATVAAACGAHSLSRPGGDLRLNLPLMLARKPDQVRRLAKRQDCQTWRILGFVASCTPADFYIFYVTKAFQLGMSVDR